MVILTWISKFRSQNCELNEISRGPGACPGKFFEYSPSRTSKNAVLWKLQPCNLSLAS